MTNQLRHAVHSISSEPKQMYMARDSSSPQQPMFARRSGHQIQQGREMERGALMVCNSTAAKFPILKSTSATGQTVGGLVKVHLNL